MSKVTEFNQYLSILIWSPILLGIITYAVGKWKEELAKYFGIFFSFGAFVYSLVLFIWKYSALTGSGGSTDADGFVLHEKVEWVKSTGIYYELGMDGLNAGLVVLTTFVFFVSCLFSYKYINTRTPAFYGLMLGQMTTILGTFLALDLFTLYLFWEASLPFMFLIILIWGGKERVKASFMFFIYTGLASLVMLIGFIWAYVEADVDSFRMIDIKKALENSVVSDKLVLIFILMAIGFLVKFPVVPFHSWLPQAHVQAPSPGSAVLAGLLLKMGVYGLIRVNFWMLPSSIMFETDWLRLLLGIIGLVSLIYASLVALRQDDLKSMIAFSSIAHMGIALLGIATFTELGIQGAIYMMIGHGVISPLLFLLCGSIEHGAGTRQIPELGGLGTGMPATSSFFVYGAFASLGLPGLASFVAEFLIFVGLFTDNGFFSERYIWIPVIALLSIILAAGYYLWAVQRVVFGPESPASETAHEAPWSEIVVFTLLSLVTLILGLLPAILINVSEDFVSKLVA